jgi:hypothetical protein
MAQPESDAQDFENEARERLARIETHQEQFDKKLDDIADGQEAIFDELNRVDGETVEEDRMDDLESDVELNSRYRQRTVSILKFVAAALSLGSGFTGLLVVAL